MIVLFLVYTNSCFLNCTIYKYVYGKCRNTLQIRYTDISLHSVRRKKDDLRRQLFATKTNIRNSAFLHNYYPFSMTANASKVFWC